MPIQEQQIVKFSDAMQAHVSFLYDKYIKAYKEAEEAMQHIREEAAKEEAEFNRFLLYIRQELKIPENESWSILKDMSGIKKNTPPEIAPVVPINGSSSWADQFVAEHDGA